MNDYVNIERLDPLTLTPEQLRKLHRALVAAKKELLAYHAEVSEKLMEHNQLEGAKQRLKKMSPRQRKAFEEALKRDGKEAK